MNCKNCGAPVDGHIACPKCGQLVDFTGSMSTPQPRSNYGISWGNEEPKIEEVNATPVEPVEKIETPVEEKVVVPVVEEKKEEPRLDTSEPASERLSIFDTFSEALNDIAEDMVEISDEIKSDLADEPEPYTYKENKYEFSGNSNSIEPDRNALDDIADKLKASESAPLIIVFGVMGLIAIICFAVGSTGSHDYTNENTSQTTYTDTWSYDDDLLLSGYNSVSQETEEEPTTYVYADLGKIYNTDGDSIDISEDAVVESAYYHQKIAYIQDGDLYLVDGDLNPKVVADNVKDFQISARGDELVYINQYNELSYRTYSSTNNKYTVATDVSSFVFSTSNYHSGFLYVKETDDGKVLYQCDKDGKNKVEITTGECTPLAVSDGLDCAFYLDENNHLHRYLSEKDSDDEYDVIINENSDYIFSDVHDDLLINNIGVDGNIYCVSKFSDELYVIDKPGLSSADICDGSYGSAGNLVATYLCNDGLIEVKFGPSGLSENIITESSNVDCFATDVNGDVVLYKLDNQLYGWFRNSNSSKVIDEEASAINKISVANTREFYYLKGSELYYIYPTSTSLVPVLVSDDVDKIVKYIDNDGQVTIGFATTDFSQYILTTIGNYISK